MVDAEVTLPKTPWRIHVDTGGTFTDCLAVAPDGTLHRAKVLSSGVLRRRTPDGAVASIPTGLEAPVVAAHVVTGTPLGAPLPPCRMRLATTRGTNALLTRTADAPVLWTTRGFADLPRIGHQQRPDLFAIAPVLPEPWHGPVVEVDARMGADGTELAPLDEAAVRADAARLVAAGHRSAAVAFLHAWRWPDHELRVAALLREAGFAHVSVSSELSATIKLVPRLATTLVDAALAPVLGEYLDNVGAALAEGDALRVMTSAGGLRPRGGYHPKDSLLSGPAGGVVGAARAGLRSGFSDIIAFDMGGTSTDVARIAGGLPELRYEHAVGGATVAAPALAIESVAAGGGSICAVDRHGRLSVGPASAGAQPGPACYGMGGPLTVTDVDLLLGRLDPGAFGIPVDPAAAEAAFTRLRDDLAAAGGGHPEPAALLHGLADLADETMAEAIRTISVRRGIDPAGHALVAFGGAGGVHAAAVAERLGIDTVVVPPDAGLLSAWGLAHAVLERHAEEQVLEILDEADVARRLATLEDRARAAVVREGADPGDVRIVRRVARLRLLGTETPLEIEPGDGATLAERFAEQFARIHGSWRPGRPIEVESVRVAAGVAPEPLASSPGPRAGVAVGAEVDGPRILAEPHGTTWLPEGWRARVDAAGALVLRPLPGHVPSRTDTPDVVERELFARRFEAIATDMGETLRRTALSVNVKERLDYSCALLGPDGALVATAAHIPVHLGALGNCVRRLIETVDCGPGTEWVVNHPAWGGSHLPDITVVTPVHDDGGTRLGFVASRAHHAEIGGTRPGSMPPGARTLAEEGTALPPTPYDPDTLAQAFGGGPFPSRSVADNLADCAAQRAANRRGAQELRRLAAAHGADVLAGHRTALAGHASLLVRDALRARGPGVHRAEARLDDGHAVRVAVALPGDGTAVVDFEGTDPVHPGNLNAPPAVVRAAVLTVVRMLVDEPVPLNEGLLDAVEIRIPEGSFLNPPFDPDPERCPAVVGGNTETSQRVVAALVRALGLCADSQGTMNNVLFGNARFGCYETVCGGAGAAQGVDGASAVHTWMTNTRITDPEILETRMPVRLERFAIRRGSGGAGRWRGGDGAVREIRFLEPLSLSVLAQSRRFAPAGAAGGGEGAPGRQVLVRVDGTRVENVVSAEVEPGDRLVLETPGGGGWGPAA